MQSVGKLIGKKKILTLIMVVIFIISLVEIVRYTAQIDKKLTDSAYGNLNQLTDQMSQTVTDTWTSDAANIREMSSVLANTDNKDTVMKDITKNDIVYRYLYVEAQQTEGVASDGFNVQKNDSHDFKNLKRVDGVELSECFLSKSGNWCYLYRCSVENSGQVFGWVYAQYLFDRIRSLFPEQIYEGKGNCYILDTSTNTIVYELDANHESLLGTGLNDFAVLKNINDVSFTDEIKGIISNGKEGMISAKSGRGDVILSVKPIGEEQFYLICIVEKSAIMTEAELINESILIIYILIILTIISVVLILTYYSRLRLKAQRELEAEREEHNRELKKALDAANAANKSKSEFLANMSHEIRTPINAVIGMDEIIMREAEEDNILSYAKDINDAAHSLLDIVNDILDISKIESGKIELIPVEYCLKDLARKLVNVVSIRAKDKNLELRTEIAEGIPSKLWGDDIRIRQIIINILTNAVKYTQKGSVTLSISGETKGDIFALKVLVEDTGIGIKPEDLPKLTEKFQRIEEDKNRGIEGTGLGMSITTELLRLMGSRLEVESVYGQGSKFYFVIEQKIVDFTPVGKIDFTAEDTTAIINKSAGVSFMAPDARILVVDDNSVNLKIFVKLLEGSEMKVTAVKSGQRCLDAVRKNKYDIVFLDHMMPVMDGVETLHELRKTEGYDKVPVIVLTANAINGAKEKYLADGFNDYLSKPVEYSELEQMIMDYLPKDMVSLK